MNTIKLLLAVSFLTSSQAPPESVDANDLHVLLSPSVQQLSISLEVLDERETSYVLSDPQNFRSDLEMLQRRYHELLDAPRVSESKRLPERKLVNDFLTFNRSYRETLAARQSLDQINADVIQQTLDETDHLYQVWTHVRDARCAYYYVSVRRQALKQLRDMIGATAFYSGDLPPNVPIWRLPRGR